MNYSSLSAKELIEVLRNSDKKQLFSYINSVTPVIPLLMKLANHTYEDNNLLFLDNYFKENCPSYLENYIEKLLLNRTLNNKFSEKTKTNSRKI